VYSRQDPLHLSKDRMRHAFGEAWQRSSRYHWLGMRVQLGLLESAPGEGDRWDRETRDEDERVRVEACGELGNTFLRYGVVRIIIKCHQRDGMRFKRETTSEAQLRDISRNHHHVPVLLHMAMEGLVANSRMH
jgi:hypothetical protein